MANPENNEIPFMQRLLDNTFLLVILGIVSPMVIYNLWGLLNVLAVPMAK